MPKPSAEENVARKRSGARFVAFGCLGLFGVLFLALLGYLSWSNQLPPPQADARVMPVPNGYDACVAAVLKVHQAEAITPPPERDSADLPLIRSAVATYQPSLPAVRAALKLPFECPPVQQANVPTPELAGFRSASRAFGLESRLALEDGHPGAAIQCSLDAVDLGARVGRGGPFLNSLVGIACTAIGVRSAEDVVKKLSAVDARAAGVRLDGIIDKLPTPASVAEAEHRIALLSAREILTGRSPIATSQAAFGTPGQWDPLRERALLFFYPKRWGYQRTDSYYRELEAEFQKPHASRKEPATKMPNDPVLGGTMPVNVISFHLARHELLLQVLRVQLALQEARQRDGRFPKTLQELVPRTLAELPMDPFDGKPLRYRLK
ncbi:MAG: hypothetical protein K0Q72_1969, partial [Armatimonadetes bacterium]|nr:hypothetical protein [Armatimonadota bacterium]